MAEIKLGRSEVKHDTPAHTPGINKGGTPGDYESQAGHLPDGRSTAERSTGVNPKSMEPIDKRMPNLSPG